MFSLSPLRSALLWACIALVGILSPPASAQDYDASWYDPDASHVKIAVVEDGVYRVTGSDVASALPAGTSLSDLTPSSFRIFEKGSEIPIHVDDGGDGTFDSSDAIEFVGQRNRGTDELWAYEETGADSDQSSDYYSLYADTTHYWLTWNSSAGSGAPARYTNPSASATTPTSQVRDVAHVEQDNYYYYGRTFESGDSFYTRSEGYYWKRFSLTSVGADSSTYTLPVARRTASSASLDLTVRLDSETSSCHRVEVAARLNQSDGSTRFETVGSVEWQGTERKTVTASITQSRIPGDLDVRIRSFNEGFTLSSCPDPSSNPNYVLLDFLEAEYTRRLAARNDEQQITVPSAGTYTFSLTGYSTSASTVFAYNPVDGHRYAVPASGGTATVTDAPSAAGTPIWAVTQAAKRSPAAVEADATSRWSRSSNGADYVILTTEALRPSAEALADYRRSQNGYTVAVVNVQNVFDEFDYGRPTPIAIRRFARATRDWSPAPQFLTIFADAPFPVATGTPEPRPPWAVLSFGYPPSDGWFAMQAGGENDFSEFLAVGRIPVRTNSQGRLFVDKLRRYEGAEPAAWQKRMLLLAGGTSRSEQSSLQFYSNRWGELATGTADSLYAAGMDTLRYYKQVDDALDTSFQDSLAVDISRGAAWLSYFGHSAAQTWEIVTDPPEDFDNAGRLPVVLSLGCKTGSFAGDQFTAADAVSLGEAIVVGKTDSNGEPVAGSESGGIAHWGTSALGNRFPSARLGDALTTRVFRDTMRVLGEAIRQAKAEIARNNGTSSVYQRHLLTYGLLGDPATRIAIPDRPELSVRPQDIRISPARPTPTDRLSVTLAVNNFGLVPRDSVGATLQWERPDGSTTERSVRLPRFALQQTTEFEFGLDNRSLGVNRFRGTVDPSNTYAEVDETNNSGSREQPVFDTGLFLVSPVEEGTVSAQSPTLRITLLTLLEDTPTVELQVDSLPSFTSPALQSTTRQTDDFVVDWSPSNALVPGQTYYWRARVASRSDSEWKEGRFSVASASPAPIWRQSGNFFRTNDQTRLSYTGDRWTFDEFTVSVDAVSDRPGATNGFFGFIVNATSRYLRFGFGFGVLVIDGTSGRVKAAESFPTYDLNDDLEGSVGDEQEAIDALRSFLDTSVETGDYVFTRTRHFVRKDNAVQIPEEVKQLFRNLGSSSSVSSPHSVAIDTLTYDHLWTMKARKGMPSVTEERVSPPSEASEVRGIVQETSTPFSHASGETQTRRVGPATSWEALQWDVNSSGGDRLRVDVLSAQDSTVLASSTASGSGSQSLEAIDAAQHPYLLFRAALEDSTDRSPPQLRAWEARYTPVPEIAIDPSTLARLPDTLEQGRPLTTDLTVRHLYGPAARNVRLTTTLTDASNAVTRLRADTLRTLEPDASSTVSFDVSTADREGSNTLSFSAMSDDSPERSASDNSALFTFLVQSDDRPPALEVTVNGRKLVPVDANNNVQNEKIPFVPLDPSFDIEVRDDNSYLRLTDTSYVDVYLKTGLPTDQPDVISDYRRIPFSGSQLQFDPPAADEANRARVVFEPSLPPEDETYTLKVEARDTQGNEIDPYQASFRIQQEQEIEDLYPYPNPMSDHTRFAFRIRGGNSRPTDFTLRIYTLSGRLVREFTGAEVNDGAGLRTTGWNFLRWNGRDQDGDRVATGVYLYRVRMEGENGTFEGDVEKIAVIR